MSKQILLLICIITIAFGCKKTGQIYTDGYDKNQENPNASGKGSDTLTNNFIKKDAARIFPGIVSDNEARVTNYNVSIDLSKKYVPGIDIKSFLTPELLFSTGLYAPAGEVIKITVPTGVLGLSAKIGGWTDVLSGDLIKRDMKISMDVPLNPGVNYVRNLYGGSIYIYNYSRLRNYGTVAFSFTGAVKSPDFVLDEMSDGQWVTAMQQSTVPWVQLRGKRIILELPKTFLDRYPVTSPTELMREWDRIIATDVYGWKGLEDVTTDSLNKAPEVPLRIIMDAQLTASRYARYGYPVVVTMDENMYQSLANLDWIKTKGSWRAMHEIGFANNGYWGNTTASWIWTWIMQPAADLYSVKMGNRLNINLSMMNDSIRRAVESGLAYVSNNLALYSSNRAVNANFAVNSLQFANSDLVKMVPFIQLFDNYGYDLFTKVDIAARHLTAYLSDDQQKIDFFYKTICIAKSIDFIPFFEMWGIRVSPAAAAQMKALYPRLTSPIYSYNPITKAPLTGTVPPPNRDINRLNWRVIGLCCQEMDAGSHLAEHSYDYNDTTFWRTEWSQIIGGVGHKHAILIDMNNYYNVKSFWHMNPATSLQDGRFTPKTMRVYVATTPLPDNSNDYNWVLAKSFAGPNNNMVINVQDFSTTYSGIRYLKVEIDDSNIADPNNLNSISLAEFGVWLP